MDWSELTGVGGVVIVVGIGAWLVVRIVELLRDRDNEKKE